MTMLPNKLNAYWRLMRADRPIGWLLLLWPTLWALWIAARGMPTAHILLVFIPGVWLTRAAGCVINDYADRWLDPHVARTKDRPLASGEVSGTEALVLFTTLMLIAFALVLTLNSLTILMSFGALALAAMYPYMKRHFPAPQMVLGMAFGFGIPMAFAAVLGRVPAEGWLLFVANILWSTAYDTWYGMVDLEDDVQMGAKSTAIWFGRKLFPIQASLYSAMILTLVFVGVLAGLGGAYYAGLAIAAVLMIRNYALAKIETRDHYFAAFRANNWIGLVIFVAIAADLMLQATRD